MKKFCESLRKHTKNIIDFEKKMLQLTKEKLISHENVKNFYICGRRILKKLSKSINYRKKRDHCHYIGKYGGATHCICDLFPMKSLYFFIKVQIMIINLL